MDISDNVFVNRTYTRMLDAERKMICIYAESCFLNIQILQGNLSYMDRLDDLTSSLFKAEQQTESLRKALQRLQVDCPRGCHLVEQECIDLFEEHFTASDAAPVPLKGVFRRSDFREMLSDIYPVPDRTISASYKG